jgi:hypothetical protein
VAAKYGWRTNLKAVLIRAVILLYRYLKEIFDHEPGGQ